MQKRVKHCENVLYYVKSVKIAQTRKNNDVEVRAV